MNYFFLCTLFFISSYFQFTNEGKKVIVKLKAQLFRIMAIVYPLNYILNLFCSSRKFLELQNKFLEETFHSYLVNR
jgi:hypothetical protein